MSEKPNLLFHSNAPHAPTGYGNQCALFCKRLDEHYRMGISAFYGVEGNILPWQGIPVYPGIGQTYGNETIREHAGVHFNGDLRAGMVVTLMDVWVLDPNIWRSLNTACWVPVDHDPLPEPILGFFQGSTAVPIAMSRFGERMLEGLDPLYCPHAIDTEVYAPVARTKARKQLGVSKDLFMVGMVAANKGNPSRKCFAEAIEAFKVFHDRNPDSRLYLHTEAKGRMDGVTLPDLVRAVGLDPNAVLFPDQYRMVHFPYSHEHMAQVYSAMDVLLAPSAGEGFGIPVIEAQACGTPVIVSDFSAQPELVGGGWTVSGRRHYTPLKSYQFAPDVEDITDALEKSYTTPRPAVTKKCREFAEQYDIEVVMEQYMLPALAAARERFEERKPMKVAA